MDIAAFQARVEAEGVVVRELLEANPKLHSLTAILIAQDRVGAGWVTDEFEGRGKPDRKGDPTLAHLVGSYHRWQWAVEHCPREWLIENIAELWRGSDPDDTDPKSLLLWGEACDLNGGKAITDGKALPDRKFLTVYRGQLPDDPPGFAWSLDYAIADKFARGCGARVPQAGVVIKGRVPRSLVFGYLTGRGESEIIVNPIAVRDTKIVTRYTLVPKGEGKEPTNG